MLRHPWAPGLISSRPTIPPSLYPFFEEVLGSLVRGGFSYHLGHRALHALGSMVLGFSQELFSLGAEDEAAAEEDLAAMADLLPHLTAPRRARAGADVSGRLDACPTSPRPSSPSPPASRST